jgi:DNA helicase IV
MPNSRDISEEQEDIYQDAPTDGSIMVAGPPGTGKTVIAFLRAQTLSKKKKRVQVLMYNHVLKKYTENIKNAEGGGVQSDTLTRWLSEWWRSHKIESEARVEGKVYLECSYEKREEVKELGARWDKGHFDPNRGGYGQWYALTETFQTKEKELRPYIAKNFELPKLGENEFDWDMVLEGVLRYASKGEPFQDWGHIIIDEAQDFSEGLYKMLRLVSMHMKDNGITILADENQRLNETENSTLESIRKALGISEDRYYLLTENFRNTREIGKLASKFYVGLPTGKPNLSKRKGDKPRLYRTDSFEDQVKAIEIELKNKGYGEVGVFAQNETQRGKLFNKLQHRLQGQYRVQTYSWKTRKENPVDELVFDKKGTVTVLNRQSCKGLEFDAVFIPELQFVPVDGSNLDAFRMNMYVMCSRARTSLYILYSAGSGGDPDFLQYMPEPDEGILEYVNV